MNYLDGFRNPGAARALVERIHAVGGALERAGRAVRLMEVCGTHTMAIARHGIRDLLPPNVSLCSGPGCPVCVTDAAYLDAAMALARRGVLIATFGDLVRVPGSDETLADARTEGGRIEICYTPLDALALAKREPSTDVVFLGVGFETTAAPFAALLSRAARMELTNFSLLSAFKTVPAALEALAADPEVRVDGLLCPAHVSAIIGSLAYEPFAARHRVPCTVAGFEPLDILFGIENLLEQLVEGRAEVVNQYSRVVKPEGNTVARELIRAKFQPCDASWRGIGVLPGSGLAIAKADARFDAAARYDVRTDGASPDPGCRCGDVLKGKIPPDECPFFGDTCTPSHPVGPCMVSGEGSCAAFYKYAR